MMTDRGNGPLWRIHIGAHKTGTTHLQETLAANSASLAAQGVQYLALGEARPILRDAWPRRRRWFGLADRRRRAAVADRLRRGLAGMPVVILSEENLMGHSADVLSSPPYARLPRLSVLAHLAPPGRLEVFMAIRSFDRMLPSAYFEYLKRDPGATPLFDRTVADLRGKPPRWTDIVARVETTLPDVPLHLWRTEDYGSDPIPVLSALAGTDAAGFAIPPVPSRTRSPGPAALERVARLDRDLSRNDRADRVRAIYADHDDPPPQLLSDAQIAELRAAYALDTAALAHRLIGYVTATSRAVG